jgi:hypothetical protein
METAGLVGKAQKGPRLGKGVGRARDPQDARLPRQAVLEALQDAGAFFLCAVVLQHDDLFLVVTQVLVAQEIELARHDQGADHQKDGHRELHHHQAAAEHAGGSGRRFALDDMGGLEARQDEGRVAACHQSDENHQHKKGAKHHRIIDQIQAALGHLIEEGQKPLSQKNPEDQRQKAHHQ